MTPKQQMLLACLLGVSTSLSVWVGLFALDLMFTRQMPWIVVAPSIAGLAGGFLAALFSPVHQVRVSAIAGMVICLTFFIFLFPHNFIHMSKNPFIWYWPFYLIPSHVVGGLIGRSIYKRFAISDTVGGSSPENL